MVDPELVAIGAEAPARLTDLGVMPEPGGEGEEPQPDAGAQARECAGAVALEAELSHSAQALDPEVETGSVCPGSRAGHLADLFRAAGIGDIVDSAVAVDVEHSTFEDWWEPFTLGVAPSGAHVAGLEPDRRTALRELCRERLPEPPFVVSAKAWVAHGAA